MGIALNAFLIEYHKMILFSMDFEIVFIAIDKKYDHSTAIIGYHAFRFMSINKR